MLCLAEAASPASLFVPSFSDPRHRQRSHGQHPASASLHATVPPSRTHAKTLTVSAAAPFIEGEMTVVKASGSIPKNNDEANTTKYEIDNLLLVEQTENTPLGQLTQDTKRDMLTVMRQLSSMGRRQDDIVATSSKDGAYSRQRRQDATTVERLLDRLLKDYQYSSEFTHDDRKVNQDNVNARTYNLAIKAWANANVRGSAEKAERILKRLKVANINRGKTDAPPAISLQPDLYSFAYCYAAWYRESVFAGHSIGNEKASSIAKRKAESVLQSMKQVLMQSNEQSRPLNMVEDVNSLLVMWSNTNTNLPDLSETFLRFIDVESTGTNDAWLNTRSYNLVINAWAKSGSNESINRAEALLKEMEKSTNVTPDLLSYSGVMSCIAKSVRATDAKKAEDVLHRMTKDGVEPDNVIVNQVMNIYIKKGSKGSAAHCEKLLKWMEDLKAEGNELVAPDVRTYNLLLSAYANEKGPSGAEKVLRRLEMHEDIKPNYITYTTCMDAYAKIGDAHNNLRILSLMEKEFKNGNSQAKPTRRAYVSALNSLAKSGRGDAGTRAEALVQAMERMSKAGNSEMKPDTTVYNVLINCHKNSAARAEKVLYRMGKRDVVSYSSVINVYSKMGGVKAAKRAQALLDEMQKDNVKPNAHTFNSAITAWSRSGSKGAAQKAEGLLKNMEELYYKEGDTNLQPSAQVYTSVISAWAKSNEPGSALRAEILLKLMWGMYKRGNKSVKPNVHTFTSVINAWARSREKEAGERAEALLDQMIKLYEKDQMVNSDVMPNVLSFTAAIHAYARTGARDGASKADGIMKKMESLKVEPNLQTYNVLISLWGNSQHKGAGKKAESILTKLEDEFRNGNKDMRPTVISYTSCINAWAKSTDYGKAESANAILERMKEMYSSGIIADQPNIFSYTAVINACATTYGEQGERQEAFRIAYSIFKEISELENLSPNHVTYSTFFRAISKLMPNGEKKESMVSAAFRLCVRDGQCDSNCLFHMKNAATPELVSDLLGCSDPSEAASLTVDELPYDWTRNVEHAPRRNKIK